MQSPTSKFRRGRKTHFRVLLVALSALLLFGSAPLPLTAEEARPADPMVVLVLAPHLTWDDFESDQAPFLREIRDRGAVANMNTASRNRLALRRDDLDQAALTYSSGSWADSDFRATRAHSTDEITPAGVAGEVYERVMGSAPDTASVVFLGLPRTQWLNDLVPTLDIRIGALGDAVVRAGGSTAAVGNSDLGPGPEPADLMRPAALVAMDSQGRVRFGDVSQRLLKADLAAPLGVTADLDRYTGTITDAILALQRVGGPSLLVIDPGDLARAEVSARDFAPMVAASHRDKALASLDSIVRLTAEEMPEGARLMVIGTSAKAPLEGPAPFTPIVAYSPGDPTLSGTLSSSSTRQDGLVTNLDIAATTVDWLALDKPVSFLGNPMVASDAIATAERIPALTEQNAIAVSIEAARPSTINTFIVITMLIFAASVLVLFRMGRWPTALRQLMVKITHPGLLFVAAVPLASTAMFAVGLTPGSEAAATHYFVGATLAIWALAAILSLGRSFRLPLGIVSLSTATLLLVDQWMGGPWSFTGILNFSPLVAARYYGMGNEGAAIMMGSLLVGLGLILDEFRTNKVAAIVRKWAILPIGVVAVLTAAAPIFGANVAVALWGLVGAVVFWALANNIRVDWRMVVGIILVTAIMLGAFIVIDLGTQDGAQTHLGRAVESAREGGIQELVTIAERKIATNIRVLTTTNWSFVLAGVLLFLGYMRWRPQGDFSDTLARNPAFSAALAAVLIAGGVAYFTEDSGIVIPALMTVYVGLGILQLMIARSAMVGDSVEPEPAAEK